MVVLRNLNDKSVVESHVVGKQEDRAVRKLAAIATVVEVPGVGVPVVEVSILNRDYFSIDMIACLAT